jgi:5,6-dimethylbenzimidazole synthase
MSTSLDPAPLVADAVAVFADEDRDAVYRAIALRRDVRHFEPGFVLDGAVLRRILGAAHEAPSVGLSQRWRFIVVRDRERRARIRDSFLRVRAAEAERFAEPARSAYLALRLEGILDSSLNVCVAVDERARTPILGTTSQPESVRASAYCAIQNLWLAARVEGLGVGWVSLVEAGVLRSELALPTGVAPLAYLCIGRPLAFRARPMLEEVGWSRRAPLEAVVHDERFDDERADAGLVREP